MPILPLRLDCGTGHAHPSPPRLSASLTDSRTPLANSTHAASYGSPAPSLGSTSSPSASLAAFSESANRSSDSRSCAGANSLDDQPGPLISISGGGTASPATVQIAETTCLSDRLNSTRSHILSPIASPLRPPCPSPRTPSQAVAADRRSTDASPSPSIHPPSQASRRLLSNEDEAALLQQAAAVEAQRQGDLFVKILVQPTAQRRKSSLLSQLMNPDPSIFPPNHPYRASYSAVDLRRLPRVVTC